MNKYIQQKITENKVTNKRIKTAIKYVVCILLAVGLYFYSYYVNGLYQTNKKLITLVVCVFIGFILFYAVYGLICLISQIKYKKSRKKLANEVVSCDDELVLTVQNPQYIFKYDMHLNLKENLLKIKDIAGALISEIGLNYGKEGKYVFLDYTSYEAIEIIRDALSTVHQKVDGLFGLFKLQDKPLTLIEIYLTKALNETQEEIALTQEIDEKEPSKIKKVFGGAKEKLVKTAKTVGVFLIKGKIESTANDILHFVGAEAFKTFSANSKKKIKRPNNALKTQEGLAVTQDKKTAKKVKKQKVHKENKL